MPEPVYGWVETRRTYRHKTVFGNRHSETIVTRPSERNARRRTRQRGGVTITEEWRVVGLGPSRAEREQEEAARRQERQAARAAKKAAKLEARAGKDVERQAAALRQERQPQAIPARAEVARPAAERQDRSHARMPARQPLRWPGWGIIAAAVAFVASFVLAGVAASNTGSAAGLAAGWFGLAAIGLAAVCVPAAIWGRIRRSRRQRELLRASREE